MTEEKVEKDKFLETENLKPEEKIEKVVDVISEKVKDPKKVEKVKEYEDLIENVFVISGICYTIFYFYNKFVKREYKKVEYEEEEEEYKKVEYKKVEYKKVEYEEEEEEDYSNIVNNIDFKIYNNIYDRR